MLDSGAKVIAPLGTGELDVGSGALSVGFWNARARGVNFHVVADRGHVEAGYFYQSVFMRKDLVDSGEFKSLKDLKGKRMGFAAQGVTSLSLLNEACKSVGISYDDVVPVYLSFAQQIVAINNKALDGSFLIEPQATVAANAGYGVRFMNTDDFYPHQQISVIFYSDKFATERKDSRKIHARLAARRARLQRCHQGRPDRRQGGRRGRRHHRQELPHGRQPCAPDVFAGGRSERRGQRRRDAEGSGLLQVGADW